MTHRLEAAFAKASELPDEQQDALAAVILREIDSEQSWDELFARPESRGLLAKLADKALADVHSGRSRKLDLSEM